MLPEACFTELHHKITSFYMHKIRFNHFFRMPRCILNEYSYLRELKLVHQYSIQNVYFTKPLFYISKNLYLVQSADVCTVRLVSLSRRLLYTAKIAYQVILSRLHDLSRELTFKVHINVSQIFCSE